ncbi:MAG: efflux RND transporter periplasmic adaptor subunit [Proteobacteria bacterium]|nr:efflux RND transporter periplasmic adaptor subunit [Pseudomonadota bacterium]
MPDLPFRTSAPTTAHRIAKGFLPMTVLVLAGCSGHSNAPEPPRSAIVAHPLAAEAVGARVYSGDVRARFESQLGFRVNGKIRTRKVDVGDRVANGQLIAELDPVDLQWQTGSARANLAAAQAQRDLTQADYDRYRTLLDKHYISQTQVDAQANALKAAQAQVQQAQAALAIATNQTEYTSLRADHAGAITALSAEAGQVVAAGQSIARLAWDGAVEVEIAVPEDRIASLHVDAPATIEAWADTGKRLGGHVREIGAEADRVTRTYRVRVRFDDADTAPRLGQTARVYFTDSGAAGKTLIAPSALYELDGKPAVWLVDAKTHRVKLVAVTVAAYHEQGVILSNGVGTQDWIVTAGVHKLHDDDTIAPIDALNRPLSL